MQMQQMTMVTKQDEANHTASATEKPRLKQGDTGFAVALDMISVHTKVLPKVQYYQGEKRGQTCFGP